MIKKDPEAKKGKPTPPAPQNEIRRAKFFFSNRDTDPHAQAELFKIANKRYSREALEKRNFYKKPTTNLLHVQRKPTQDSEMEKV